MKYLNKRKNLVTIMILLAILFCAVPVMAQSAGEGLFLKETKLEEGDSIFFDDVLTYQKIISSKEQRETIVLPEGLIMLEQGTDAAGTQTTVSGAVPIKDTSQYMVTIPCMIRPEAVIEGSIFIEGMKLSVSKRPQTILGETKNTLPLPGYDMNLYKTEEDLKAKKPLANKAEINLDTPFFIGITKADFVGIIAGNIYTVDLPKQINSPQAGGTLELKVEIDGNLIKFGTLSWGGDSKQLSLVFEDFAVTSGGVEVSLDNLTNITMGFECRLDKDRLNADENGKVNIDLPGNKTLEIIVPELKPKPPEIQKSVGALEPDGTVLWTITYTHPVDGYKGAKPASLVDTIPDKLQYVTGSGKVYLNDSTTPGIANLFYSDGKLTYDIAAAALNGADKVKITYQTKLTKAAFSELWAEPSKKFTYANKVEGLDEHGAAITPSLSATAKLDITNDWPGRKVISKEAEVIGGGDTRTIKWKIVVNAQSQAFQLLQVIDTMGKGLELQALTVKVVDKDNNTVQTTPDIVRDAEGRTIMAIVLVKDRAPSPAAKEYTITYETEINPDYFNNPGSLTEADISNHASLIYSWPTDVGPSSPAMPPVIVKKPGDINVNNTLIGKKGTAYDYTKNAITWDITINPNQVNLTKAVFVDDLKTTDKGHAFVLSGGDEAAAQDKIEQDIKTAMKNAGLTENKLTSVTLAENVLTVELGEIGKNTFTFPVTTYVTNPEAWAGNGEATYHNTVIMQKDVTVIGTTPITADVPGTAEIKAVNNVLKKAIGNYIPEEKKIEWTLTVNENAVNLGQVTIVDVLSEPLSCSPQDVAAATLDGAPFGGANTFSVDESNQTITIELDSVNAKKVIKFKTSVDVDAELFRKQENIPMSNQAGMVSTANGSPVKSNKVDITLVNQVIDKKGEKLAGNQSILAYRINLNPAGMDLLKGQPAGTKLTISDKLSDGLYLDLESIKLYHATKAPVSAANGTYTIGLVQGAEVTDAVIDYQASDNSFSIEIPDPSKSYIVKYHAFIVKVGVDLKNNVKIMGSVLQGGEDHLSSQYSFRLSAFGSAGFSLPKDKFISLRIKKVDKGGSKLTGAEFALYADKKGERLLAKGTTDDGTGICTLAIPKSAASGIDTLYWKEITAPVGYEVNDQWHEVKTASIPDTDIIMVNLQPADAALGRIKIKKTDEAGTALTGAAFAVYKEESCETLAAAEKSVDAAGEVTFDGLYPDRTYWVKEIKAPKGYVPVSPVPVKASNAAVLPANQIKNEKADVTLEITKVDGENSGIKIQDVEFGLYEDAACTKLVGTVLKTNPQGVVSFQALMPHTAYYLKETKAAADYIENTSIYTIMTADNKETLSMEIANYKIGWDKKSSIQVTKTDAVSNIPLSQVSFRLYEENKTTVIAEVLTNQNGICLFENLKPNTAYFIKETKVSDGYIIDEQYHPVTTGENKTMVTISLANYKIGWDKNASIEINKTDASGNVALEHAAFALYADDKTTLLGEATTDKDGRCVFTQLKEGTYYVKETKAPEGYKRDDSLVEVQVLLNEKAVITVKNAPIVKGEESSSGSENGESEEYITDTTYDEFVQDRAQKSSTIPKTGVEDKIIWYALGLAVSLLAVGGFAILILRKKRR